VSCILKLLFDGKKILHHSRHIETTMGFSMSTGAGFLAFWHLCGRKKVERINTSKVGDCQSLVASHPDPHLPPQPKRNLDAWALKKPSPSISNVQ